MPNQVLLLPNRLPLEWLGFRVPYQRRYARLLHLDRQTRQQRNPKKIGSLAGTKKPWRIFGNGRQPTGAVPFPKRSSDNICRPNQIKQMRQKHSPLHIQQLLNEEYGILHDNHQLLFNRMEHNPGSSSEILTTKIRHDIKIPSPHPVRPRLISRPQYLPPQILGRHSTNFHPHPRISQPILHRLSYQTNSRRSPTRTRYSYDTSHNQLESC
jgi:hypothetical protein